MKHFILILIVVIGLASFNSCDVEPNPTSLEITVKDDLGNPISGATVKLYIEFADLQNQRDQIGTTQISDALGKVKFDNLDAIKYYWFAESDCLNNYNGSVTTTDALTEGLNNTLTTILTSTGTLKLKSNSTNPYKIYINGTYEFDVEGGETTYSFYRPTGSYSIRVLQKSGYLIYPTDITYTGTINCGSNFEVIFPD